MFPCIRMHDPWKYNNAWVLGQVNNWRSVAGTIEVCTVFENSTGHIDSGAAFLQRDGPARQSGARRREQGVRCTLFRLINYSYTGSDTILQAGFGIQWGIVAPLRMYSAAEPAEISADFSANMDPIRVLPWLREFICFRCTCCASFSRAPLWRRRDENRPSVTYEFLTILPRGHTVSAASSLCGIFSSVLQLPLETRGNAQERVRILIVIIITRLYRFLERRANIFRRYLTPL